MIVSDTLTNLNTFTGASFPLRNRLRRAVWGVIYIFLFRFSPRPVHKWRSFLLRLFGATVGKGVHVYPGVKIWAPWNLEIGDNVGIADGVTLYTQDKIKISDRCVISQNSYLCTGTHDYTTMGYELYTRPIFIDHDCWLAAGVFVHPGVSFQPGTVVGAHSVVTKNLPAWSVCAGNPCVFIKTYLKK